MADFTALILAFMVAFLIALLDLTTSKFPQTYFLMFTRRWVYCYAFLYGIIGIFLDFLIQNAGIKTSIWETTLSSVYLQAAFVGLFTKSLTSQKFLSLGNLLGQSPVGIESLVKPLDSWLLNNLDVLEFITLREFVEKAQPKYNNIADVLRRIEHNIPTNTPAAAKTSFLGDLNGRVNAEKTDEEKIHVAMELYVRAFGKGAFKLAFPNN